MLALVMALGLAARWPFLHRPTHRQDLTCFVMWAMRMQSGSLADAYKGTLDRDPVRSASNYPPGYLYVLRVSAAVYRLATGLTLNEAAQRDIPAGAYEEKALFVIFKLPAVLADLATAAVLMVVLRRWLSRRHAAVVAMAYALQPGVIYNSARWGQVDAVPTLLMVLSLEMAARRRYVGMSALAAAALLVKLQAIVLAPVWLLCLLFGREPEGAPAKRMSLAARVREILTPPRLRRIGFSAAAGTLVFVAGCLPFVAQGEAAGVRRAYLGAMGHWPVVSANAFNLWSAMLPLRTPDPKHWVFDTGRVGGLTYHSIGLLMLAVAVTALGVRALGRPSSLETVRWLSVSLCLCFFTFPTQIHERYLHPVLAIAAWAYVPRSAWWLLWLTLGWVYALNLVWVLPFEPGWIAEAAVDHAVHWTSGAWIPSRVWGALTTLITLAVAVVPPSAWWRDEASSGR